MAINILSNPKSPFQWIDIEAPTEEELIETSEKYGIHKYSIRDCMERDHLPKIEHLDNFTFIISRFYIDESKKTDTVHTMQLLTSKVAFFYNDKILITIHRLSLESLAKLKLKIEQNLIAEPSEIVVRMMWHIIHSYEAPAILLMSEIDDYEEKIFLKNLSPTMMKHLYFIKRKTHIATKLLNLTAPIVQGIVCKQKVHLNDLQDLQLKLQSINIQNLDDINSLLNFYLSLSSQKTNEVMRILTVFSAFFLPLTFIAGVYGMNFANMPELTHKYGYPATWAVMILVTIIIIQWFWRKKWL